MNPLFSALLKPFNGLAQYFIPIRGHEKPNQQSADNLLVHISLITSVFAVLYCVISYVIDFKIGIVFELICFVLLFITLFYFKFKANFRITANLYIANCLFVSVMACSYFSGGLHSQVTPWFALIPIASLLLLGQSLDTLIWFLTSAFILIGYGILDMAGNNPVPRYNLEFTGLFFLICLLGLISILTAISLVFEINRKSAMIKILEQNESLEQAKIKAEESTRTKSEFLANMSHEIRTPMNAIVGFSNLALKTPLTPKQKDYISKIDVSSKALLGIINDILDFSKIEAGKLDLERIPFNLEEVFMSLSNIIASKASEKGIEFISHIHKNVPYDLIGDPLRLGQILLNFTNNAVKFTDDGQISVIASAQHLTDESCTLLFTVKDTGIGISPEILNTLFTAFTQADASITRKYGGTGLGLSISKNLISQMGGEVYVESEEHIGSTFSFTATFDRQTVKSRILNIIPSELKGFRILVVDDNDLARELISEQLSEMGFEVICASSGLQSIEILRNPTSLHTIDLVLMDWHMPQMDGLETIRNIFNDVKIKNVPMVFMISAYMREDIVKRAESLGVKTFIVKPVNQSLLYDAIVESIGTEHLQIQLKRSYLEEKNTYKFYSRKLLLVEDNIMNQEIACELLKSAGFEVVVAQNGKEAVALNEKNSFDLVLMDLQMPVMSGLEATEYIRSSQTNQEVIIIAMTAHAVEGVKEECLAKGMNDYVTKPIDSDELFSTLSRWVEPSDIIPPTQFFPILDHSSQDFFKSISKVNLADGLKRMNSNSSLYKELLINFSNKSPQISAEITEALNHNDIIKLKAALHTLKGLLGNLSFEYAYSLIHLIENDLHMDHVFSIKSHWSNLNDEINAITQEIQLASKPNEPLTSITCPKVLTPLSKTQLQELLYDLRLLMEKSDLETDQALFRFLDHIDDERFSHQKKKMILALDNYDFEGLLDPLNQIIVELQLE